jgi:thiol:disulfide interchange protein DsbD
MRAGPIEVKAAVSWLECAVQCIPGSADVKAAFTVGAQTKPSEDTALFATWQKKLPLPGNGSDARAWWEKPAAGDLRPLVIEWNSLQSASEVDFFPDPSEAFEVQPATERLPADAGKIRLRKIVKKISGDWPRQVAGVLIQQSGANQLAYAAVVPIELSGPAGPAVPEAGNSGTAAPLVSLWKMLLYAFVGGLILNIMPCVLPVIALKILGFVGESHSEPGRVRQLGLVYALGVLVSFLALAALVIGLKAAGRQAGWGLQFSNPLFVLGMTVLVTLVALNLFGVFEVTLGSSIIGTAGNVAASRQGAAGAFFNGVFATILATPCTAPFLAPALGFAFSQPPALIVLIFLTVGLGLASPYVVLSWHPAWLKFLPKPGAWMEKFKIAMGFPMLVTALWLLDLAADRYGERSWWLGFFLVIVALAAWVFGEFVQRSRTHRGLGWAAVLILLTTGYGFVLEGKLRWRSPGELEKSVAWQPWSSEAVAAARAEGRPVLVDFTARWCATCNQYVKPALQSAAVRKQMADINAVALLGDYTDLPPIITSELNRFQRAGVPLVLVYPKNAQEPPVVVPDAITQGGWAKGILAALDHAAK